MVSEENTKEVQTLTLSMVKPNHYCDMKGYHGFRVRCQLSIVWHIRRVLNKLNLKRDEICSSKTHFVSNLALSKIFL